jgi:hypothetical protein
VLRREVLNINNTLWIVKRRIRIDDRPIVQTWKEHLHCDKVFKKEPYYYFCEEVTDVEWENI